MSWLNFVKTDRLENIQNFTLNFLVYLDLCQQRGFQTYVSLLVTACSPGCLTCQKTVNSSKGATTVPGARAEGMPQTEESWLLDSYHQEHFRTQGRIQDFLKGVHMCR